MIIDDYFSAIERGLQQNVQIGKIEEPLTCKVNACFATITRRTTLKL